MITLCPTSHRNVHHHLVAIMKGDAPERRCPQERKLAELAVSRWAMAGGSVHALAQAGLWEEA